jgi:hypothetical protein
MHSENPQDKVMGWFNRLEQTGQQSALVAKMRVSSIIEIKSADGCATRSRVLHGYWDPELLGSFEEISDGPTLTTVIMAASMGSFCNRAFCKE